MSSYSEKVTSIQMTRKFVLLAAILSLALILPACSHQKYRLAPYSKQVKPQVKLQKMGYSIQIGAFTNVSYAARLTAKLDKQGYDAFYFKDKSGMFKVRYGNYKTRDEAKKTAEKLLKDGVVEAFYIVDPQYYPVAHANMPSNEIRASITQTAETYIGIPYKWGGCALEEGVDCSGFVMAVYQLNGLNLPRTSSEQYNSGTEIDYEDIKEGDLVFFDTNGHGSVSHVGIYIGDGKFIHAPGIGKTIRTDQLASDYFRTRYLGAKTYIW